DEIVRLKELGANKPLGRPYTKEEIMACVRGDKQRGNILGVGRVLAERGKSAIFADLPRGTYSQADIDEMLSSRDKTINEEYEIGGGSVNGSGMGGDEDAVGNEDI
ncbi:hypothetical protein Tco_1137390, partial [Tanacetum coccineum]